jgi:transcription elongation factor SPT5
VFQICRRCLEPSEIHPPAITSAFARSSIPGYVFIEAFYVGEVCRAVNGLVTISDKLPWFISPTEYVGLLSCHPHSSSRIEVGQWVRCLVGRYRNDVGYVHKSDEQWDAIVVFVPRISQPRGKRQRDGRPPPRAWTSAEIIQLYGQKRVKVLGPNMFTFRGGMYEDGLVKERVPLSHLRILDGSPGDITPFVRSSMLRTDPLFAPCVKRFTQESTQVGDRIRVVSGGSIGIIGRTKKIHDGVAEVVTQSPEQHLGLIVAVTLRDLMPHFQAGDHVKDHWSDRVGIVVTINHDGQKLTFLEKDSSREVSSPSHLPSPLVDFWTYRSIH